MKWYETLSRIVLAICFCFLAGFYSIIGIMIVAAVCQYGILALFCGIGVIISADYYACMAYEFTEGVIIW